MIALLAGACTLVAEDEKEKAESAEPPPPAVLGPGLSITQEDLKEIALEAPVVLADDLRITHVGVGIFELPGEQDRPSETTLFRPMKKIRLQDGRLFGWVIRFDTTRDSIALQETFELPAESGSWSGDLENVEISQDGKVATSSLFIQDLWDWTYHSWGFELSDPVGTHVFKISLDGEVIATLPFTVVRESE